MFRAFFLHLNMILHHKVLVFRFCRKCGLLWQGLWHDMSKFYPVEFFSGVKYYQGDRSPNDMQRIARGYSIAWLNHKGRNRHHLEFWIDYNPKEKGKYTGLKMPLHYLVESVCDRIAASKIYNGATYQDNFPLDYYIRSRSSYLVHEETDRKFMYYFNYLAEWGEEKTFTLIRDELQNYKKTRDY